MSAGGAPAGWSGQSRSADAWSMAICWSVFAVVVIPVYGPVLVLIGVSGVESSLRLSEGMAAVVLLRMDGEAMLIN